MKTTLISLRIIALFVVAITCSYFADQYHVFFGDYYCQDTDKLNNTCFHTLPTWHWGFRRYLFFVMGTILFVIQSINVIKIYNKK